MKRALVSFAVLLIPLTPAVFGRVPAHPVGRMPSLNVEAICKARSTDARILRSTPDQSTPECIHDEEAAKQQLNSLWTSTSIHTRNECESDARSLGTTSYLDLLTCVQITEEIRLDAQKKTAKQ